MAVAGTSVLPTVRAASARCHPNHTLVTEVTVSGLLSGTVANTALMSNWRGTWSRRQPTNVGWSGYTTSHLGAGQIATTELGEITVHPLAGFLPLALKESQQALCAV